MKTRQIVFFVVILLYFLAYGIFFFFFVTLKKKKKGIDIWSQKLGFPRISVAYYYVVLNVLL